jgi:hypothetical protein
LAVILPFAVPSAVSTLLDERERLFDDAFIVFNAASTLEDEFDRLKLDV